jgi:hypothetical protein
MAADITDSEDVREHHLRQMARQQGLALERSRKRNPQARGYGTYQLVDRETGTIVKLGDSSGFGLTADEIAAFLTEESQRHAPR